jgi:hypothetical protein
MAVGMSLHLHVTHLTLQFMITMTAIGRRGAYWVEVDRKLLCSVAMCQT